MSYIVKHPKYGVYTGHFEVPRFTHHQRPEESPLPKWKIFADRAEAYKALSKPGMEGCTVEPEGR